MVHADAGERPAGLRADVPPGDPPALSAEEFEALPGVSEVTVSGPIMRCTVDGSLDPLIKAIARHEVVDMLSAEPDLEETFLSFYYHSEGAGHAARTGA